MATKLTWTRSHPSTSQYFVNWSANGYTVGLTWGADGKSLSISVLLGTVVIYSDMMISWMGEDDILAGAESRIKNWHAAQLKPFGINVTL